MPNAICTVSAAPVRLEPTHRSEMTTQLLFGETVAILEEREEWFHIQCDYDGYEGWLTHHLVAEIDEKEAARRNDFVTTGLLNTLQSNSELFQIPMGCSLTGYNENTGSLWDARYHYEGCYRNPAKPVTKKLFQTTIQPWLNAPYLWGGKTFMGVDCSGFVQTVFKILGVPLLRDAYQQAEQGITIRLDEATEGDVAFFKNESGRITHVGIVLDGGKIIHASGKVRMDRLMESGIFTEENRQTHAFHSVKRFIEFSD